MGGLVGRPKNKLQRGDKIVHRKSGNDYLVFSFNQKQDELFLWSARTGAKLGPYPFDDIERNNYDIVKKKA